MRPLVILIAMIVTVSTCFAAPSGSMCIPIFSESKLKGFNPKKLIGYENLGSWKKLATDPLKHDENNFTYFAHAFHTKWSTYQKAMNNLDLTFSGERLISLSVITNQHKFTLGGLTKFDRGAQNYGVLLDIDPSKIIATSAKDFGSDVGRNRSELVGVIEEMNQTEPIKDARTVIAEMDSTDVMSAPHSEVVVIGSSNHKVVGGFITVTRDMTVEQAIEGTMLKFTHMYGAKDRTAFRKYLKYLKENDLPIILLKVPPRT